jgi:hypothetical protein
VVWRYAPVLPIADPAHRVSLGEGQTPLLECPRLAKQLGVRRLLVKFEGSNPTGTVKDRTSATAVGAALQFGFTATSVVSSGNAGSSIAAYSARAGLRSLIFCYERASAPKMLHMAATASDLVLYRGVYDDLITTGTLGQEGLFFDCSAPNPYKHGGKAIAYEIAEQLRWRARMSSSHPWLWRTFIATRAASPRWSAGASSQAASHGAARRAQRHHQSVAGQDGVTRSRSAHRCRRTGHGQSGRKAIGPAHPARDGRRGGPGGGEEILAVQTMQRGPRGWGRPARPSGAGPPARGQAG